MATKVMLVRGMTCQACEHKVVDALTRTGASEVRADFKRGEVVLEPGSVSERQLRETIEALGYRAAGLQSLPVEPGVALGARPERWAPLVLLLPAICCGAPLLLAAAAALGFGTWLAANRLLVASGVALAAAVVATVLWLRGRGGLQR